MVTDHLPSMQKRLRLLNYEIESQTNVWKFCNRLYK